MKKTKYYSAMRAFHYGETHLQPGQVITLVGAKNDQKLILLGYLKALPRGVEPMPCELCGSKFIDPLSLSRHILNGCKGGEDNEARGT